VVQNVGQDSRFRGKDVPVKDDSRPDGTLTALQIASQNSSVTCYPG
jgi:hypothetical protein